MAKYTCLDCIWQDQCFSSVPCSFLDIGKYDEELFSEDEIKDKLESDKQEYLNDYYDYINEFN